MILTLIGMLLLFCAVMLLLSLIVSSLVELLQKAFNWRHSTLKLGVTALSFHVSRYLTEYCNLPSKFCSRTVQHDLETRYFMLLEPLIRGHRFKWLNYARTQVSLDELHKVTVSYLKQNAELTYLAERELKEQLNLIFSRLEIEMKAHYRRQTHSSALVFSFIVACSLQLNAFTLLEVGFKQSSEINSPKLKTLETQCTPSKSLTEVETLCFAEYLLHLGVIKPSLFPYGSQYYYPVDKGEVQWLLLFSRIVGLLVCIILISLGAPFWFERLKSIYSLQAKLK